MQRGFKSHIVIRLSEEQRTELERWQRSTTMRAGLVRRAKAILLLAGGMPISRTAKEVGLGCRHVYKWAKRFLEQGIDGLSDKPGRGRKPSFPPGGGRACRGVGLRAA